MAIRFQWCRSLGAEDFPITAYDQLRTQVPDATPFNTLAWLQAAEFALLPDQQLQVLLGWEDQAHQQGDAIGQWVTQVMQHPEPQPADTLTPRYQGQAQAQRLVLPAQQHL